MASKKKGLSHDEKRRRLLDIFYSKKDFFLLKELEKIAPKEKGIVLQSVKDVLQSLVDDDLVDTDKIGTSVYFWAFPSKATAARKRKLDDLDGKIGQAKKRRLEAEGKIEAAQEGREDCEERRQALNKLIELKAEKEELLAALKQIQDSDPELIQRLKKEVKMGVEGANRWTDNIFSLHCWVRKKFPAIQIEDLNKQFGIPEDLDYVEADKYLQ